MRELLTGRRPRIQVGEGIPISPDRHWRRVPKVNLLPRRRRTTPVVLLARVLLVLILAAELFWVQKLYRDKAMVDDATTKAKAALERDQRQLTAEQRSVEALQGQLTQLQQQREAKVRAYKEATGDNFDWHTSIATLLAVKAPEVTFESAVVQEGGRIVLTGVTQEAKAMATLPIKLKSTAPVLDFQSIKWEAVNPATRGSPSAQQSPILKFTATFTARR